VTRCQRFTNASPAHTELLRKAAGVSGISAHHKGRRRHRRGEHGDGALLRVGPTVHYYSLTSASLGPDLGVPDSAARSYLFMTREALAAFEASHTFNVGVDAQVALVSQGAGGAYDSETLKSRSWAFVFDEKGLIGDLSLKGSRIKQIEPK